MSPRGAIARAWRAGKLGLAFLTVVPVRFREGEVSEADLAASRRTYPLVGAFIGLALAGISLALSASGATPSVSAFCLTAAAVVLTGGIHIDGVADTADGLFLAGGPGRRLVVMRDPHVGSFGVTAVVLTLLGKYAVVSGLSGTTRAWALLAAGVVSRSLVLVSAGTSAYARNEGTGRVLIDATDRRDAVVAGAAALCVGWGCSGEAGLVAAGVTVAFAVVASRAVSARLGGITGDTLGALVESGELLFLLGLAWP